MVVNFDISNLGNYYKKSAQNKEILNLVNKANVADNTTTAKNGKTTTKKLSSAVTSRANKFASILDKLDGKTDGNFQVDGLGKYFTKLMDKADGVEDGKINFESTNTTTVGKTKKNVLDNIMDSFDKKYQIDSQKNTITSSTYGAKKNLLSTESIKVDSKGNLQRKEVSTYNEKGKLTEFIRYNRNGNIMSSTSYDAKGNLINKKKSLEEMLDKLDGKQDKKIDNNNVFVKFLKSEIDKADGGADNYISGNKITSNSFNMIINAKVNAENNSIVMNGATYTLNDKGEFVKTSA